MGCREGPNNLGKVAITVRYPGRREGSESGSGLKIGQREFGDRLLVNCSRSGGLRFEVKVYSLPGKRTRSDTQRHVSDIESGTNIHRALTKCTVRSSTTLAIQSDKNKLFDGSRDRSLRMGVEQQQQSKHPLPGESLFPGRPVRCLSSGEHRFSV